MKSQQGMPLGGEDTSRRLDQLQTQSVIYEEEHDEGL